MERLSSDDEEPDKILPPGILSRSIGGVDSEAHQALHNVQACLSYQYWSVRHRSFQKGFNIGSSCPRPKRVLLPMEACLQILATFNATKSAHERQWVFTVPFPFHSELWWLRGARIEPYTLRPARCERKTALQLRRSSWRRTLAAAFFDTGSSSHLPAEMRYGRTFWIGGWKL